MPPAPPRPTAPHPLLSFLRLTHYTPPPSHRASFDPDLPGADPQWYRTLSRPRRMGNMANYAYGGYALSLAVFAACQSVWLEGQAQAQAGGSQSAAAATAGAATAAATGSTAQTGPAPSFSPYSAQGVYLRPALTDRPFAVRVGCLRRTRTFRTMEVRVYQPTTAAAAADESLNLCLTAVVDCMARSKHGVDKSILRYTSLPAFLPKLTHHSQIMPLLPSLNRGGGDAGGGGAEDTRARGAEATAPPRLRETFKTLFAPLLDMFELRCPLEGIWAQNMWGLLPGAAHAPAQAKAGAQARGEPSPAECPADAPLGSGAATTQDALRMSDKRGYEWLRPLGGGLPRCAAAGSVGAAFEADAPLSTAGDEGQAPQRPQHLPIPRCASAPALTAFLMDAALSFTPLSFSRRFLPDAAACASLDFSLRFHDECSEDSERSELCEQSEQSAQAEQGEQGAQAGEEADADADADADAGTGTGAWYLREIRPCESSWERSYSEGKLWREEQEVVDRDGDGGGGQGGSRLRCVATMTQACVLKSVRPAEAGRGVSGGGARRTTRGARL